MGNRYGFIDFTEDESTDAIPNKHILTITEDGEEYAVIVHRATDSHPIDGALAQSKTRNAEKIVAALNFWDDQHRSE